MSLTPKKYLPPPWLRRAWVQYVQIPLGSLFGYGYWFIDSDTETVWLSDKLRSFYDLPAGDNVEPYSLSRSRMWDDETAEYLDRCIAVSRENRIKFKLHFYIRDTHGNKRLHFCIGHLLFRKGERQPWAIYGWTAERHPSPESDAAVKGWKATVEMRRSGRVPEQMKKLAQYGIG
jgi:hypothetical protein